MFNDHSFNFEGGEYLSKIGASWFCSALFYENISKDHLNWRLVDAWPSRYNTLTKTRQYHRIWLEEILEMNNKCLNTNFIGLNAMQIKSMAKQLLKVI